MAWRRPMRPACSLSTAATSFEPIPDRPILSRVGHQLRDPMILLLCGALAVVVAVGDRPDATIIAAVVVLNTVIGVVQEVRAQHAIDALSRMARPSAHVRRDGGVVEIPAATSSRATWSGSRRGRGARRPDAGRVRGARGRRVGDDR